MNGDRAVRLVVFAKPPISGRVKTRLAATVGEAKALELYRTWVPPYIERLHRMGPSVSMEISLALPEGEASHAEEALDSAKKWLSSPVDWSLQEGRGLGERLAHAFNRQFDAGWKRVFAVGTDSPHLSEDMLRTDFALLDETDLVLGPTQDGGYYAIGMSRRPSRLFEEVRWSTESTLGDTLRAARAQGWKTAVGPLSYDIDTLEDLERLIEERGVENWPLLETILNGE